MAGASYLDTSALVKLLQHERESEALVDYLQTPRRVLSSVLSRVETVRACLRVDLPASDALELLRVVESITLEAGVVRAAGALLPPSLRSLDAIHLASTLVARSAVSGLKLLSLDDRVRNAARKLGVDVLPEDRDWRSVA